MLGWDRMYHGPSESEPVETSRVASSLKTSTAGPRASRPVIVSGRRTGTDRTAPEALQPVVPAALRSGRGCRGGVGRERERPISAGLGHILPRAWALRREGSSFPAASASAGPAAPQLR